MTNTPYGAPVRRSKAAWTLVLNLLPVALQPSVKAAYLAPDRHYHDAQHVGGIWETWTNLRAAVRDVPDTAIMLAAAYHDIVYNPRAKAGENERASALLFGSAASSLKENERGLLTGDNVVEAMWMIEATANHATAGDHFEGAGAQRVRLFCDLDLSGLACPWEEFDDNTRLIRLEYHHLSDAEFAAGRQKFCQAMLAQKAIFRSGLVPEWWEKQARDNLQQALAKA